LPEAQQTGEPQPEERREESQTVFGTALRAAIGDGD
jgi:hypothetical protein